MNGLHLHYAFQHLYGTQCSLHQNKHRHDKTQAQNKTQIINQPLSREEAPATDSPITHHALLHTFVSALNTARVFVCVCLGLVCIC